MVMRIDAELVYGAQAELGEGPLWDDRRSRLVFVDINGRRIHLFDPRTARAETLQVARQVSALGLTTGTDWVAAAGEGFVRIDPASGAAHVLVDVERPEQRTRMNDGAVDPAGRFWAGTMSLDGVAGQGTLYRLDADLTSRPMVAPVTTSNGPAWSPDGRLMYYVDTRTRRVDVFDFDATEGTCANRRPFVSFADGPARPDGVIVDAEGAVWVGLWLGFAVHRYTPDGLLDMIVDVPTASATKCAFGGDDLSDLYITTALAPLDAEARLSQPGAGGLFHARPGVRGLPAHRFGG